MKLFLLTLLCVFVVINKFTYTTLDCMPQDDMYWQGVEVGQLPAQCNPFTCCSGIPWTWERDQIVRSLHYESQARTQNPMATN